MEGSVASTAVAFGERGAKVALLARGESGLQGVAKDVEAAGGQALVIPTDVATFEAVEEAAEQVESTFGPIDVWVNVAFTSVFAPFRRNCTRRVQAGDRGQLSRLRLRHDGRIEKDEAEGPRHHRPGGLHPGLSGDSAPDGLLRFETRHPGLS